MRQWASSSFWQELGLAAIACAPFAFPWKNADAHRRAVWALVLLMPPLFTALWGQHFSVGPSSTVRNPRWVSAVLDVPFWAALALPTLLVVIMRGARLFLLLVGVACFAVTYWLAFMATMSVTGNWL